MVTIGSYKIDANVFMSPMAGVTDLPFRLICREHGAKLAFFEMIDCNSIIHGNKKGNDIIKTVPDDRPIAAQLVGPDPDLMLEAAKHLVKTLDIKLLDVNAACPVPKIIKKKAGAYFLKEPENLYRILNLLSSKLELPVTVKLRSGYHKKDHVRIEEIAKKCEANGAGAIFIHGRTQDQGYSGDIDLEAIKIVKHAVKIPVFGSGNILNPELAKQMMDATGCDGIMVARGAYGNPWIFNDIEEYLRSGKLPPERTIEKRFEAAKKHLGYIEMYRNMGAKSKIGYMRKVAQWYAKGHPYTNRIRRIMGNAVTKEQLVAIMERTPEIIGTAGAFPLTDQREDPQHYRGHP
jgi:nifR3 family TIM-barrel protein